MISNIVHKLYWLLLLLILLLLLFFFLVLFNNEFNACFFVYNFFLNFLVFLLFRLLCFLCSLFYYDILEINIWCCDYFVFVFFLTCFSSSFIHSLALNSVYIARSSTLSSPSLGNRFHHQLLVHFGDDHPNCWVFFKKKQNDNN